MFRVSPIKNFVSHISNVLNNKPLVVSFSAEKQVTYFLPFLPYLLPLYISFDNALVWSSIDPTLTQGHHSQLKIYLSVGLYRIKHSIQHVLLLTVTLLTHSCCATISTSPFFLFSLQRQPPHLEETPIRFLGMLKYVPHVFQQL